MEDAPDYFKDRFYEGWLGSIAAGLQVDVFIWDDFRDRLLISNLVGIAFQNGFDTSSNSSITTHWSCIGTKSREGVSREFE